MQTDAPPLLPVDPRNPDRQSVGRAVAALREGALIILPTDTVYGVAADPRVPAAVERLFAAKGRDRDKPIPFLADDIHRVEKTGAELGRAGRRLAKRYWPGPLTLVLRTRDVFEGFRVPDHAVSRAVLRAAGSALRVTSANRSGEPPARTAREAVMALGRSVALALDAGSAPLGKASTVVKIEGEKVHVLREGALSSAEIHQALEQKLVLFVCSANMCRSPMAEHLLRDWLGPDSDWTVASAGISATDGLRASDEAIEVLKEHLNIDLTPHRSRRLTRELIDAASLVVVMTASHRTRVLQDFPEARGKVFPLTSFGAPSSDPDIEDPIGAPVDTYRQVRDRINTVLPDLLLSMQKKRSRRRKGSR